MSLENLLESIEENKIVDTKGNTSFVFDLIPKDSEQLNDNEFINWSNQIKSSLNQVPSPTENILKGFKALFGQKSEVSNFYKFYSFEDRLFLNTTDEDFHIEGCKLLKSLDHFECLIKSDDFNSDVLIKDDYVHFNSMFLRMVNLYEMPKLIHFSELQSFGDYVVFFKKLQPEEAKRKVNTQRKLHHANLYKTIRNLESEASYRESEEMVESMMVGDEFLFECEIWFIVRQESLEALNNATKGLLKVLKQREINCLVESDGLSELFPTLIFGVTPLFKRSHDVDSSFLLDLLPFKHDTLMDNGFSYTTRRGNDVKFTLFNESSLNFNALFTGVSGSGKSMGAQKLVNEEITRGAKVVVLDLGNSFRKLAMFHNGNVFSEKFNPLQFRDPKYLKEFVTSVIPLNELTHKLEGKIFKIIQEHYLSVKSFKELVSTIEIEVPEISLYFSELWEFFTDDDVLLTDITYVDTSFFPDKIKAPLIIYLIEYFKALDGKKIFVFDEVWSFLRKNSSYIEESFRTFRKSNASAVAISQALSDFTSTEIGRVIADLSFYKFVFSQNSDGVTGFTDFDHEMIKSVHSVKHFYSEFYLKSENFRKVLRYYPTDLEYVLFNTEPKERSEFEKFNLIYGDFFDFTNVIHRFVDFKYHNKGAINV